MANSIETAFGRPELLPTDTPDTLRGIASDFKVAYPHQLQPKPRLDGGPVKDLVSYRIETFGPGGLRSAIMNDLTERASSHQGTLIAAIADRLALRAGGTEGAIAVSSIIKSSLTPWTTYNMPDGIETAPADPDTAYAMLGILAPMAVQHSIEQDAIDSDGEAA